MSILPIFVLLILIIFIPIYIEVELNESKILNIRLHILKIFKIKINKSLKIEENKKMFELFKEKTDTNNPSQGDIEKYSNILEHLSCYYNVYKPLLNYILNKIKINKIIWITTIGLEDAALTGISIGLLWSIKSMITSFISSITSINNLEIDISPIYNRSVLDIYFHCIIKFKLVYIIIAGIKFLKLRKKGCELNVGTSN